MIYFIQAGKNGPIKIGCTENDIEQRIAQLQTGCPYKLNLLWLRDEDDESEAEIHERFKSEKIRGEWFRPSSKIFNYIDDAGNCRSIECLNTGNLISVTENPFSQGIMVESNKIIFQIVVNDSNGEISIWQDGPESAHYEIIDINKEGF